MMFLRVVQSTHSSMERIQRGSSIAPRVGFIRSLTQYAPPENGTTLKSSTSNPYWSPSGRVSFWAISTMRSQVRPALSWAVGMRTPAASKRRLLA